MRIRFLISCFSSIILIYAVVVASDMGTQGECLERTVTGKIETAYESGRIDFDTALLYKAYAVKNAEALPAEFRSDKPLRCGTLHLLEAFRNLGTVSQKTRDELAQLLTRPTLSGPEITITSAHFKIHYTTSGADAVTESYAQNISSYAENCWNAEVTAMGWEAPPADNVDGNEYDVYILDNQDEDWIGYTEPELPGPDPNQEDYTSFLVVADDLTVNLAKVTVAHEFNHACQFSYSTAEAEFWYENCATWMEDMVYDGVNDYYNYLTTSWKNPLYWPELSITKADGQYEYGACVFVHYLAERHSDNDLPRKVWDLNGTYSGNYTIDDINTILSDDYGSSFQEALKEYSVWRYFTGSRSDGNHFSEGGNWVTSYLSNAHDHDLYPVTGTQADKAPNGYGTNFIRFESPGAETKFNVTFDGRDGYNWGAMIAYVPGTQTAEITLGANGSGSLEIDLGAYSSVVLVPVVTSASGSNLSYAYSASAGDDQAPPTMESISEVQSQWHKTAPSFSNFGFDDNINLDDGWYQLDGCAGSWTSLFTDFNGQAWDDNGWTVPGFDGLSQGSHAIYFKADDDAGNIGGGCNWSWTFKKDTASPSDPSQVRSTSHQVGAWSQDRTVEVVWNASSDPSPGSGLDGYSILWNISSAVSPDAVKDIEEGVRYSMSSPLSDGKSHYFHVRSVDAIGNASNTVHLGPFYVDTSPPVNGTIRINNGAGTTTTSTVALNDLGASDLTSGMGVGALMRFSNDGVVWSQAEGYTATRQNWDLTDEVSGGNPYGGTKTVYVMYQDAAGNWSDPFYDRISYEPALAILAYPLAAGYVGFPYSDTLVVIGGTPPYEWKVTAGALPQGLVLYPETGVVAGMPSAVETAGFSIEVMDADQGRNTADFTVAVFSGARGDVNVDGSVNILDALQAVNHLLGIQPPNEYELWSADCNGDGALNIIDILGIVHVTLGLGTCSF